MKRERERDSESLRVCLCVRQCDVSLEAESQADYGSEVHRERKRDEGERYILIERERE